MSPSDFFEPELTGQSDHREPAVALREALSGVSRELVAAGGGPHHLVSMEWVTLDPSAFDPTLYQLDLTYREVFGGFRPKIAVRKGSEDTLAIRARARIPRQPASSAPVWRGLAIQDVARQYSPRGQVADMGALFQRWSSDGAAFRAGRPHLDIAYGKSRYETLDVYRPPNAGRLPLWIFIHGGYWQASDKDQHAQFAAGMMGAGYVVANLNYGLCPDTSLERMVAQIRAAISFLVDRSDEFNFDPAQIHLAGHSAGGHLAAMAAVDYRGPPISSALLLSGLFDLAPLALLPVAGLLGLSDKSSVTRLSPVRHTAQPGLRVGVAVGSRESDEFKWQSEEIAKIWGAEPPLVVRDANHFELLDGLNKGELLDYACAVARSKGGYSATR